ncbi:amino acid ABC transporter substrate-binding protein [Comamonas serinivorans]|uniref:Amino acid ABC transporter substrate-binding protein n=1 Tax=Comamonas serinivorans TaxID=1082851 RepID=A0A1Y0EJG9_9BURK|nr:transporter substrate-binding domain-containing protein [Comamonas serinivorans]ARU03578.1 amino acid ABC transporter substrate-binding protein [Comamonas serinivorans]
MATTDPIQVGVLFSRSGVSARFETSMLLGTIFAINEINEAGGLGGRELIPVHYDPQSSPKRYAELATRLIRDDRVQVIFGCAMSNTRKAVLPVIERANRLLFYPSMYEGFEFSPNVIYTGGTPNQHNAPLTHYMSRRFGPRVYMVGSDYIFPYESNRTMSDFILQQPGGKKLGERYVKLDAQEKDFVAIVRDIRDKQPDFVFSTVVGRSTRMFYQAYADAGLDPARMPIASLTTSEPDISEMGSRIAEGHYTAATYFRSIATPRNQACITRFAQIFGDRVEPNVFWEAAYFQVHLFAKAFAQAGSDVHEALLPHVLGCELEAPQGRVRVDPITHHTRLNPRIGRVGADGQFTIVAQTRNGIDADPYLVSHDLDDWTQVLQPVAGAGEVSP